MAKAAETHPHLYSFLGKLWSYDWYRCKECGREIFIRYEPYEKIVVEDGDEAVIHNMTTSGFFKLDNQKLE